MTTFVQKPFTMFKLLFSGFLLYLAYRLFLAPPRIDRPQNRDDDWDTDRRAPRRKKDDDYVDYEELD